MMYAKPSDVGKKSNIFNAAPAIARDDRNVDRTPPQQYFVQGAAISPQPHPSFLRIGISPISVFHRDLFALHLSTRPVELHGHARLDL